MVLKEIIAKKRGETEVSLYQHSIDVADKALGLFDSLWGGRDASETKELRFVCYLAALLHDIGKCSDGFQNHLKENGDDNYPYHNALGSAIVKNLLRIDNPRITSLNDYKGLVANCIMYHHPVNEATVDSLMESDIDLNDSKYTDVIDEYVKIINDSGLDEYGVERKQPSKRPFRNLKESIKYYKAQEVDDEDCDMNGNYNVYFYILTNIIKRADWLVSLSVTDVINRNIEITEKDIVRPEGYDGRFDVQLDYTKELITKRMGIFTSETGFGKTMFGLQYGLLASHRRIYWVCPRNAIAEGVYSTIITEIENLKLTEKLSVGLLLTNEWKAGNEDCDIIVTNIDNFLRPVVKNDAIKRCCDMLLSTVIFDEFHEYVTDAPIMALFDIMLKARQKVNSHTLLLSATPIHYLIPNYKNNEDIVEIQHRDSKISSRRYKIKFVEDESKIPQLGKGYLVSTNAVRTAQMMVEGKLADEVLHSRFFGKDIEDRFIQILEEFGKENANIEKTTNWSATNMLSTGVNISFDNMAVIAPIPNLFIQTIGRCNRWSDDKEHTIFVLPCNGDSEKKALEIRKMDKFYEKYYNGLKEFVGGKDEVEFGGLYDFNRDFIKNGHDFEYYIDDVLRDSYKRLSETISYNFAKSFESDEIILGKNKLREGANGEDRYFCKLKNERGEWIEEPFVGDDVYFNFKTLFARKDCEYKRFKNKVVDKIENDKNYGRTKWRNVTELIPELKKKARNRKSPFPIVDYFHYDSKLGLVKDK